MPEQQDQKPWKLRSGGDTGIADYDNNPFIACLPPPPSERDCFDHLVARPECTDAERALPSHLREQLLFIRMKQAFFPTGAQLRQGMHIDLLIRGGYVARSPSAAAWQAGITELATGGLPVMAAGMEQRRAVSDMAADSMASLGPSGIGKTTVVRRMLDGYPQVVRHSSGSTGAYTQIVWLRVEAASDGSTKQTVLSMFAEIDRLLGTNFVERHGRLTREQLLTKAQQICARYAIGLIVVDEIQNLVNSRAGHNDLMSFLTSLVNVINVPILMIGTMKALPVMTSCFRTARRGEGSGSIVYEPIPNDHEWRTFVRALFNFQWTAQVTEFSQEFADTLWDESQGIIDIAVKLYVLTQMRAIRLGSRGKKEIMTKGLIQTVAKENLKLVLPMLDALRRKDWKALQCFEDLAGLDVAIAAELQKNWSSAAHSPDLEALASSLAAKVDGPNGEAADSLMTAALVANGISPGEMSAVMAMLAKMRASSDPIAEAGKASEIQAVPRRTKGKPAKRTPPTEPIDVRVAAFGDDPLSRLAAAGLLDKA